MGILVRLSGAACAGRRVPASERAKIVGEDPQGHVLGEMGRGDRGRSEEMGAHRIGHGGRSMAGFWGGSRKDSQLGIAIASHRMFRQMAPDCFAFVGVFRWWRMSSVGFHFYKTDGGEEPTN